VKALAISLVAGAALCSVMSAPAATMPMSNLAVAASDLALGQSVRYRHRYRLRSYYSGPYYGYGAGGYGYGAYGYGGYRYGPSSYRYGSGL
jgi:hypothetical protein